LTFRIDGPEDDYSGMCTWHLGEMAKKTTILECVSNVRGRWARRRLFWNV
jgi:hypothetical protein